jgi:hypothetical protein
MESAINKLSVSGFNQEQWHSNEKEGEEIWNQECGTTSGVAHVREPPNITKTDRETDA